MVAAPSRLMVGETLQAGSRSRNITLVVMGAVAQGWDGLVYACPGLPDRLVQLRLFKCCDLWLQQTSHVQPLYDFLNNVTFENN